MHYGVPDVQGLSQQLWGDRAFMCPYCHGWEHRDERMAILGGSGAAHRVALLRSWTSALEVLANGEPTDDLGDVPVDEQPVASVAPGLVRFEDGGEVQFDALHVVAPMAPRDGLVAGLGVETTESQQGTGFGDSRQVRRNIGPRCLCRRRRLSTPATSPPPSPPAASRRPGCNRSLVFPEPA